MTKLAINGEKVGEVRPYTDSIKRVLLISPIAYKIKTSVGFTLGEAPKKVDPLNNYLKLADELEREKKDCHDEEITRDEIDNLISNYSRIKESDLDKSNEILDDINKSCDDLISDIQAYLPR